MDLREPLDFEDASFDLVICALTLAHLQDWEHPFAEFARILRPVGHVVVHGHHPFVDYLELEAGSEQVLNSDPSYSDIEAFDRPWGPDGHPLRFYRRPLGEFLRPALSAGFNLDHFIEPGTGPHETNRYDPETPPRHLLIRYQKPANGHRDDY